MQIPYATIVTSLLQTQNI